MNFQVQPSSVGRSDDRLIMKCASQQEIVLVGRNFFGHYDQLTVHYDPEHKAVWVRMDPKPRPCFNPDLLEELKQVQEQVACEIDDGLEVRYFVLASGIEGVFNYGGDLDLFISLIRMNDRNGLLWYAQACIEPLYANMMGLNRNLLTITLQEGDALGGGLEAARSSHILVAARGAKCGLPEVKFNMIPGMGAVSLLSRRLSSIQVQRMIMSGRIYTAEELSACGVVDILAEDGAGEKAVYDFIREADRHYTAYLAFLKAQQCCNPITYQELMCIAEIWVDAALCLGRRDIQLMERLVGLQTKKLRKAA